MGSKYWLWYVWKYQSKKVEDGRKRVPVIEGGISSTQASLESSY
jgi:hypothetical protein